MIRTCFVRTWSLPFASVATILAITVDRYLYIVKPLKHFLIVTRRRVFSATSRIWLTVCFFCVILYVHRWSSDSRMQGLCDITEGPYYCTQVVFYVLLTLNFLLNFRNLRVSRKQHKRISKEFMDAVISNQNEHSGSMKVNHLLLLLRCWQSVAFYQQLSKVF